MELIRLTDCQSDAFSCICRWYYHWLGKENGESPEEVLETMRHSVNTARLPQTFVVLVEGKPAGMYQLAMCDDLATRPDLYPWLINLYVDEAFRGLGAARFMLESVQDTARAAGLEELYLYTKHKGLYEKFGWEYVETVRNFRKGESLEKVYRLTIRR